MDPRYPVGKFAMPTGITPALRQAAIEEIACVPVRKSARPSRDSQIHNLKLPTAKAAGLCAR